MIKVTSTPTDYGSIVQHAREEEDKHAPQEQQQYGSTL